VSADLVSVAVEGLYKSFGPHSVLTGVGLSVPAGSMTAILGSSGSGKTTLLRIIAGFERPDAGTVRIGSKTVADERVNVPTERRRVGYVAQEGSLFPHLDVRANVGFGLPRSQRRSHEVDELLEMVGLSGLGGRFPHELSGGQQQRVALARALAIKPGVILLDEPFASLDANLRSSVRRQVCDILGQAGTTAILVTHDQDEALSTADSVAVLRKGTIAQVGPPAELYSHPVDGELASFIGEANLVVGIAEGDEVTTPFGSFPLVSHLPNAGSSRVTVLFRPEQLRVGKEPGVGVPAVVLNDDFHGHDATVWLAPERSDLPSPLLARVAGHTRLAPGDRVLLAAVGPVQAWPAATSPVSDESRAEVVL
jgi:iron(III) transport system ATP-binding protein